MDDEDALLIYRMQDDEFDRGVSGSPNNPNVRMRTEYSEALWRWRCDFCTEIRVEPRADAAQQASRG
jgi:hypothetical protein